MRNARYMGLVWVVAAAAALLGAACASGEDRDGRPLAGDQADYERTGEAEQRFEVYRCYYHSGWVRLRHLRGGCQCALPVSGPPHGR